MRQRNLLPLVPGLALLAVHPATWLVQTWFDPAYGSIGGMVFVVCAVGVLLSVRTERLVPARPAHLRRALALVLLTAAIRVVGQVLNLSIVGALALVVDVYAIGLALGLDTRRFALRPSALAALFALCLPVGRVIERAIGYPLQLFASDGACRALSMLHGQVTCVATQIQVGASSLSVDLPCSGARGLVHLAALGLILTTLRRLEGRRFFVAVAVGIASALASNALRIVLLAEGILAGIDVAVEPTHSIIGLIALAVGALPMVLLSKRPNAIVPKADESRPLPPLRYAGALLFVVSLVVIMLPSKPIDVSPAVEPLALPEFIGQTRGERLELSAKEAAYLAQYGGEMQRADYDGRVVMAVRTKAPLRHLHPPTDCLRGAGHKSKLLGIIRSGPAPVAVYRSEAPDGQTWRVEVSYVSANGEAAESGAEVGWRWLRNPSVSWTMIQRITPFERCETNPRACEELDHALLRTYLVGAKGRT